MQATQNLVLEIKESGAIVTVDPMPVVLGSETHLVRVFQNLISNAVKYRAESTPEIRVTAARRGPQWQIGIADNGLGIALEDRERVFLPFVRLMNRDVAGTGLGLAVCKKIVEELGGSIQVESLLGGGSTFSFTIAAFEGENDLTHRDQSAATSRPSTPGRTNIPARHQVSREIRSRSRSDVAGWLPEGTNSKRTKAKGA
jgi:signal transduction histidine kinase